MHRRFQDEMVAGAAASATLRQPSRAEEILEVEREQRVSKALQAQVEEHGITTKESPKGRKPQAQGNSGVSGTPKRTPKKAETPSPVKTYPDGTTWTIEDGASSEEEQGEARDEGQDDLARSQEGDGARASLARTESRVDQTQMSDQMTRSSETGYTPMGKKTRHIS